MTENRKLPREDDRISEEKKQIEQTTARWSSRLFYLFFFPLAIIATVLIVRGLCCLTREQPDNKCTILAPILVGLFTAFLGWGLARACAESLGKRLARRSQAKKN